MSRTEIYGGIRLGKEQDKVKIYADAGKEYVTVDRWRVVAS
jgi:hypothetical protein